MSQVVKAITATPDDRRRVYDKELSPIFTDVFEVKEQHDRAPGYFDASLGTQLRYRIGVTIGNTVWIDDDDISVDSSSKVIDAVQRTRKAVVEAIFGEFRGQFYRLEKALYDRDYEQARYLLAELERSMFSAE
jgi:hypothetical protein